jgi:NAD(P)-dependent dehydrogenase (short-subunit alcohol dehydrogenase family)
VHGPEQPRERAARLGVLRREAQTIEETAELVEAAGGAGVAVRTDHASEADVAALAARVGREHGRLDVLVLDFWGDEEPVPFGKPFWEQPLGRGRALIERTLWPHVLTVRALAPLLVAGRKRGPRLVVEVTDGPALGWRGSFYFDLAAVLRVRLAWALAQELAPRGVTALALTPGYLRSEATLDRFGVTEARWRDAVRKDPNFAASETPCFVGRAVAALAADADVARKAGGLHTSWELAAEYGFTDVDGARPDFGKRLASMGAEGSGHAAVAWRLERRNEKGSGPFSPRRRKGS